MNATSLRELMEQEHHVVFDVAIRLGDGSRNKGEFEMTARQTPKWIQNKQYGGFGEAEVTEQEIREDSWRN